MKYNKLVRDKIPEIIKQKGEQAKTHTAGADEYRQKLHEKLHEEVDEFLENPSEEELADIMEVLSAITELHGLDKQKSREVQKEKAATRGGFKKRMILDETN